VPGMERWLIPVGVVLLLVALVLLLAWLLQRSLIYFPSGGAPGPVEAVLPGGEEVTFVTEDGLELAAWFLPPDRQPRTIRALPAAVVVFNGNGGNRALRAPLAEALAASGIGVLLFDYRGYGGNPGSPTEEGLAADARAAVAYLEDRAGVDPDRIVYFGESLGAAVAVGLTLERPPAGLILRSPFTSLVEMAGTHYPFLPSRLLLKDRFPSIDRIGRVTAPLLVIVGTDDAIVPPEQSRRLFAEAGRGERLLEIAGADHNDYALLAGEELVAAVVEFVAEAVGEGGD
jgi:uncharacterized protein